MDAHNPYPQSTDHVFMIGLDFGSTTSSALAAAARVGISSATGRMELRSPRVVYRSEPVFTPFSGDEIDILRLNQYINQWITASGVKPEDFFAGGVIITGLAAKRANAKRVAQLVSQRIGEAVIATADDPRLESWLAFMGGCSTLSRFHAGMPFINMDIGGGTTNPAYGVNGAVLHTGCHFIGARHFCFQPGTFRLTGVSNYGRNLLRHLGIRRDVGDHIDPSEKDAILDFYITALEAIAAGDEDFFRSPHAHPFQQVSFGFESRNTTPILVFSGGVGELVYQAGAGAKPPGATYFGDLGIDLARRIVESPLLSAHIDKIIPENRGRATVYGLTLHNTELSGSTTFISDPNLLPRRDLPIVARLPVDADEKHIRQALELANGNNGGACIQVLTTLDADSAAEMHFPKADSLARVKTLGQRLRGVCAQVKPQNPVVLLTPRNYGQTLGNYATNWRQDPYAFIIIDEIPDRQAHFVNIGRLHNNIAPVSFYGVG